MNTRAFTAAAALSLWACVNPAPQPPPETPDAGQDAGTPVTEVEGCLYIGGLDRIGFRRDVADGGPCVTLLLVSPGTAPDGGLELPPGWGVQWARSVDEACSVPWGGGAALYTDDYAGRVRFLGDAGYYADRAEVDVWLRFDGGPGAVELRDPDVPLSGASCLP